MSVKINYIHLLSIPIYIYASTNATLELTHRDLLSYVFCYRIGDLIRRLLLILLIVYDTLVVLLYSCYDTSCTA